MTPEAAPLPCCSPSLRGTGMPAVALAAQELCSPPVIHGMETAFLLRSPVCSRRGSGPGPCLASASQVAWPCLLPAEASSSANGNRLQKRHGGKLVVKSCHLCIEGKPPCGFHHPAASPLTQQPDTVSRSCQDEGRITLYASSLLSLWLLSRGLYHHGRSGGQAGLQFGCRQAGMLARVAPCHGITVMQHVPFSGLSLRQPRGKRGR